MYHHHMTMDPLDDFKILRAREFAGNYILLCHVPRSVTPWVTWISSTIDGQSRYSGHYYFDVESAQIDFDARL